MIPPRLVFLLALVSLAHPVLAQDEVVVPVSEAFEAVLGFVPRIVLASICGYLVGQLLNAYVLVKIKERTKERYLWVRLIGSTVVGEFARDHGAQIPHRLVSSAKSFKFDIEL